MPEVIAGKYEVLETIGRGGMGSVYKAHQKNLDRVVAVKMLSEELAADDEFRARFQQEATIVARLGHPNIVAVYDIEPHNHTFCIIMEYLQGETLQQKVDRDVTIGERDALTIGAQIARALHYAHGHGIVHRDIKPDNIHISQAGVAKVMDFGIARFRESKLKTQTGISMGTPKFMSPEQVTGKGVDGQTDLYSLGVCLYTALAGRVPFDGENAIAIATRHLYEPPEPPSHFNTAISPATEKVILRALEKSKADRYKTGNEMATALESALNARLPIRLGDESHFRQAVANATERMVVSPIPPMRLGAAQTGGASRPLSDEDTIQSPGSGAANPLSAGARSTESPGDSSEVPQGGTPYPGETVSLLKRDRLDDRFTYTPPSLDFGQHRRRSSGRWWLIAAILLIAVAAVASYVALAQSRARQGNTPNQQGRSQLPTDAQEFRAVQQRSDDALREGRIADALTLWTTFRSKHPNFKSQEVGERIDKLEARLPLSEKLALSDRRQGKGNNLLQAKRNALAAAYLRGAAELGDSRMAERTLAMAENSIPPPDRVAAAAALARARQQSASPSPEALEAFYDAITLDPTNPLAWRELGDYHLKQGYIDDARVAYTEARFRAPEGEKAQYEQLLSQLVRAQ